MMFTGTNQQQDTRFSDKEKKLLKQMKFGDCLNKRVDMSKVKLDVLRPWISKKITDILHIEDDVVVEFVYNQLEEEKYPCPKKMQINMTGFLNGKNARQFMGELWALLLSAQDSESGIPAEFIQQKKDEILKREEEQRQEQGKRDRSRSPFGKDRDRDIDRDKDRSNRKDRSGRERSREHSIVRDLPASTLSAIEQVRSQLSTNSRSSSTEKINLSNTKFKNSSYENVRNRSKSPNQKCDYATKSRNRSRSRERRRSRDRSIQRVSRERNTSPIRRRNSRDRDRRRSRSPRRRSIDRKRRTSRSRDRSGRQPNHRRSRSSSPPNRNDKPKLTTSRRSLNRRSKSKSPENRRKSPNPEPRNYSSSPNTTKSGINGIDNAGKISDKKLTKVQGKLFDLASGNKRNSSTSRSRSKSTQRSPVPSEHKRNNTKSRSRSLSKRNTRAKSSSSRTSSSRSSIRLDPKRKIQRSLSRDSRSASASPDNRRSDFEIQKSKNSIQKKRHYRNNRDSSSGSSVERTTDDRIGEKRREGYRRQSPRGKSPNFRNQRSRSRRRSRTRSRSRSRIRNRSRSPIRRSRSPRRFNRRWSPSFHHYRGRGVMNRSRANNWRRSRSRGRGGGGGRNMSPQRRFSPPRRYSRDRRSPQLQVQQRDRKFSPVRRHSPPPLQRRSRERRLSPRDRRPSSRDRRQSSPIREFSRERRTSRERRRSSPPFTEFGGRMKQRNENRWETQRNEKPLGAAPRGKQRVSSESSNWEEDDQPDPVPVTNKESPKKQISAPTSNISPIKNSGGRREKSKSLSQERNKTVPSPIIRETAVKNKLHPAEHSSLERSDLTKERNMPVSSRSEKDDSKRKTKSEGSMEVVAKQQQVVIEEQVLAPSKDKANKEISRPNYSSSLSRTPSPFLKPHEREKASQVVITQRKQQIDKKTTVVAKAVNTNDSDSSSSDSSMYSSEIDEEESVRTTSKKKNEKKVAKSSDSERSIDDKKVPTKGKRIGPKDTSRGNILSHKNSSEIKEKFDQSSKANRLDVASASSDLVDRSMPSSDSKNPFKTGLERRHVMSTTDSEEDRKSKHPNANASGHKRTLSTSGLKKQESDSSDSDYDQTSKKKRKKNKKMAKRNSDIDSSDSEAEAKKKKHKKHKKHSKKNKKHKKHKKKSKKAETSSSDDDTDSKPSKIQTIKGRFPAGINEDLEKQLRERALKSMKKID